MIEMELDVGGVSRIEIDESELIGRKNQILWMIGLIDRKNNDARVFCKWKIDEKKTYSQ